MKETKGGRILTTVPTMTWWLFDRLEAQRIKRRARMGVDAIDNLERLYLLKERGIINDEDFQELKEKVKKQI